MLLTTGNKCELAVGYCTLYGDMCGGLAVISDVPKTLVYDLARYVNREREVIPRSSITKPPERRAAAEPDRPGHAAALRRPRRVIEGYVERGPRPRGHRRRRHRPRRRRGDHRAHRSQRVQAPAGRARPEDHVRRRSASAGAIPSRPTTARSAIRSSASRSPRPPGPDGDASAASGAGAARSCRARRAAAGAARHALRAVTHRTSPSRTSRRRDLRLGHRAGARRPRPAAHRESRPRGRAASNSRRSILTISGGSGSSPTRRRSRRSARPARYGSAALAMVSDRGLVYWCDCSRQRCSPRRHRRGRTAVRGPLSRLGGWAPAEPRRRVRLPSGESIHRRAARPQFTPARAVRRSAARIGSGTGPTVRGHRG